MTLATVTQSKSFDLNVLPLSPVTNLPVLVNAAPPVDGIKRRLAAMTDEVARSGEARRDLLAKTWEVVQSSPLQRKGAWAYRHDLERPGTLVGFTAVGALLGAVVTGFGAAGLIEATTAYIATVAASSGVCASIGGLFAANGRRNYDLALAERTRAEQAMVELAELQPLLDRFNNAAPAEKLAVGLSLEETFEALNKNQQLAPESVAALEAVVAEIAALEHADGGQARRERSLQRVLTTAIEPGDSLKVASVLDKTSDAERPLLAQAVMDVVFSKRDLVSRSAYAPRNELFKLLQRELQNRGTPTAVR